MFALFFLFASAFAGEPKTVLVDSEAECAVLNYELRAASIGFSWNHNTMKCERRCRNPDNVEIRVGPSRIECDHPLMQALVLVVEAFEEVVRQSNGRVATLQSDRSKILNIQATTHRIVRKRDLRLLGELGDRFDFVRAVCEDAIQAMKDPRYDRRYIDVAALATVTKQLDDEVNRMEAEMKPITDRIQHRINKRTR